MCKNGPRNSRLTYLSYRYRRDKINNVKYAVYSECWRSRRAGVGLHKKNHISPGQDDIPIGKDRGLKLKLLEDQAEYYDYLDDEV